MRWWLLIVVLLTGCAARKAMVEERAEIEAEAVAEEELLEATGKGDALHAIATARDRRADAESIVPLIRHRDPRVRREAARALGLIGDPTTQGTLEAALTDVDLAVRSDAAFALSQIWAWELAKVERVRAEAAAETVLIETLGGAVDQLRRQGVGAEFVSSMVRALAEFGDGSDDAIREVWGDARLPNAVRAEALLADALRQRRKLAQPFPAAAVAPLAGAWAQPDLRFAAAYLLGRLVPADDAREPLAALLQAAWPDADEDARAWLLRGAGPLGVSEPILATLADGSLRLRINAVRGAGDLPNALLLALEDPDRWVRAEAFGALARTNPQPVLDLAGDLVDMQVHSDPWLRARALEALAAATELVPQRRAVAMTAIQEPDPDVRAAGWTLLGALPDPMALSALLAAEEPDRGAQLAVALAVAGREEPEVEARLREWLTGPDPVIAAVAADGLSKREGTHLATALMDAWRAFPGEAEWERRKAIVDALAVREDLDPRFLREGLVDPSAHVRIAAFRVLIERSGRSALDVAPTARTTEAPADAWFGVDDVERAVITTAHGDLTVLLYPRIAPAAVANFVALAEAGTYDGLLFHRVVPDFVVQGGDPENTGWGGPGYTIRDEFSPLPYVRGTLGMARSDKDTAGSQWFITHSAQPHLDGHYTAFGQLLLGWDALTALRGDDVIESVRIVRKPRSAP